MSQLKKSSPKKWKLVWGDEFNYTGLPDSTKWNYDVGGDGWGNHEMEYYTDKRKENARVENGLLIIEARKENYQEKGYTSARLITKGKGDWQSDNRRAVFISHRCLRNYRSRRCIRIKTRCGYDCNGIRHKYILGEF